MRSFWLCKKAERRRALRTKVVRPTKGVPHVEFEIVHPNDREGRARRHRQPGQGDLRLLQHGACPPTG